MGSLSMVEARLPPGFRFHPRDDELVIDYLSKKLGGGGGAAGVYGCPTLVDVDLNKCEPWDLPAIACIGGKEWYFYSLKDRKYATGQRTNRATESGYWKVTGKDREIGRKGLLVGMRKTLVFYRGRAPKGKKTDWVMHEFRKEEQSDHHQMKSPLKEDWVLCKVFYKSRTTVAIQTMENTPYINGASPSQLHPVVDNSVSFNLSGVARNLEADEQVPCFSSSPQPSSTMNTPSIPAVDLFEGQHVGKTIKDVLNQFTRFEGLAVKREVPLQGLAQDGFENYYYLTENGSSQTWNTFMI